MFLGVNVLVALICVRLFVNGVANVFRVGV